MIGAIGCVPLQSFLGWPHTRRSSARSSGTISLTTTAIKGKTTPIDTKIWWKQSKCYKRIEEINPTLPSTSFIKATVGLNRRQPNILTQLRTGHIPLTKHLRRVKWKYCFSCSHCPRTPENINHISSIANKYALHRHKPVTTIK